MIFESAFSTTVALFAMFGILIILFHRKAGFSQEKAYLQLQKLSTFQSVFQFNHWLLNAGITAVILLVWAMALVTLVHLRQVAETRTVLLTKNLAETLELTIERIIEKTQIVLLVSADEISHQIATKNLNLHTISDFLEKQKSRLPEVDYLRGTNEHGDVVYAATILSPPVSIADRDYFLKLRNNPNLRLMVSLPVISKLPPHHWVWPIVSRINKPDGSFGGVVYAGILLNNLNNLFSRIKLGVNDSITLRDLNLGLMARYPEPTRINLPIGDKNISIPFREALAHNPLTGTYISGATSIDGISWIHSYQRNKRYGFIINVGISCETALAEWHKQVAVIAGLVLTLTIALLIFSRMMKRAWLRQEQNVMLLQTSEQVLHEVQQLALLGSYRYDLSSGAWTSSDILDYIFGINNDYPRNVESWISLIVPESQQEMLHYFQAAIEQQSLFEQEYQIIRRSDAQKRWVHDKAKLQFDDSGKPLALIGTVQDITEHKQTENVLRESEARFYAVFNNAAVGLAQIAITGQFLQINQEFCKIIGYSQQEVLSQGFSFQQITFPGDLENDLANFNKLLQGRGDSYRIEKRYIRKDGNIVWVNLSVYLQRDWAGKPLYFISAVLDISERKRTETKIKTLNAELEERVKQRTSQLEISNQLLTIAKEAAEAANIAKSTFIATMSHELRTPLNAILGFSELMSRDDSVTAAQKDRLAIINRSGEHLLSMINEVLDISKIEAGRMELNIHDFDLLKLLHDIGDMISVRAAARQLNFKLDIAADIPQYIKADNGKLRQILINLLGNSIKFTQEGEVILRAHAEPLANMNMAILNFEVVDSGIGIAAEQLEQLFKPFVQLTQTQLNVEGSGLGLAISKSLLELMGGSISVNSIQGQGSTFMIELPVHLTSPHELAITETSQPPVKNLAPAQPAWRLLVVDDIFDNRLLLVTMLSEVGLQVREAANGQEAIQIFEQWQPDLIFMDMRMPVLDGHQATAKIRQLPGGAAVKIIAVTASAFKEQHNNILKAGCDAVLHKPVQAVEVFTMLSQVLGVKFMYQDQPEPESAAIVELTAEILANLPPRLLRQLHQAALNLDIEETETVIEQIRHTAPEIADSLQEMAQHYQFEQIIYLTQPNL